MSAQRETRIQREIQLALGAQPDLYLMRNSVGMAMHAQLLPGGGVVQRRVPYGLEVGSADLVALLAVGDSDQRRALWFALEVKCPGETPTQEQIDSHARWRKFGAWVDVVTGVEEAVSSLNRARAWAREALR